MNPSPAIRRLFPLAMVVLPLAVLGLSPCLAADPLAVPISGKPLRAELSSITAEGQVTFVVDQKPLSIPAVELVTWGQCVEQGRGPIVVFADGSVLAADTVAADADRLTIDSPTIGTVKLPLELLAGIVYHAPSNPSDRDRLFDRLLQATGDSDRLFLENGDELTGQFLSIADDTLSLDAGSNPMKVKTDRIAAVQFNPALRHQPAATQDPRRYWLGLADGSRLLGAQVTVDADSARATVLGQLLVMPTADLVFLQPIGGRTVYLSDLKPANYRQTPYLDLEWPYRPDRNATGGMLRANGQLCLKGLGLHSAARVEYDVSALSQSRDKGRSTKGTAAAGQGGEAGIAPTFQAELAIDDSTERRGSALFRVFVDGQEKFTSPVIRGGDAPTPVAINISNAKKLELVVDYADRADVLDRADWLNARITK